MSTSTLDVLGSFSVAEASPANLYAGDGTPVTKAVDPKVVAYKTAEAMRLIRGVAEGRIAKQRLREAMTTSDFPIYFGAVLNRILLAGYAEQSYTWAQYIGRRTVPDFREVHSLAIDGGDGRLDVVGERAEYPERNLVESEYVWRVQKRGGRMGFSFEMDTNDDLDAFRTIPDRFGRGARRTEEYLAASLLADANGPRADFWNAGNGNVVTGNPVLSRESLQAAYTQLTTRTDPTTGEPIAVEAVQLVVGPALTQVANEILNTTEYRIADGDNIRIITGNGLAGQFRPSTNHYIPFIATANAATSWWLLPAPSSAARPVAEMGFLRGHETPEVFIKAPNANLVGGGQDPFDFATDSIEYKVRHVLGGGLTDPVPTVASNGSGTP